MATIADIAPAIARLVVSHPDLGSLLAARSIEIPNNSDDTFAWTIAGCYDKPVLLVNPDYINTLSVSELEFVLAVNAVFDMISDKKIHASHNAHRWQMAINYYATDYVSAKGIGVRPSNAVYDPIYGGKTVEEIYNTLEDIIMEYTLPEF